MRIAFYAPMKPPDDPTPSGDRQMARLLVRALEASGHEVTLASRLRSWVRDPAGGAQARTADAARAEAARVLDRLAADPSRPDIWITYHLYHKAPDWIGPAVADRLGIPYVVVEASRALKRKAGPWAFGFAEVDRALARADAVVALHGDDAEGLAAVVGADRLKRLAPFIDTAPFRAAGRPGNEPPVLVTVAMMRAGDKQASYEVLAEALVRLGHRDWRHLIVGDGPRRQAVKDLFDPARTTFLGSLAPEDLPAVYRRGDVFVWPAVREAFGLVFLEAQAAGLAVVAGRAGGVAEIVADGVTGLLVPVGDAGAFAAALDRLLADPERRRKMGAAAARHAGDRHDIRGAGPHIDAILEAAVRRRDGR